jgi:hypothetical protein
MRAAERVDQFAPLLTDVLTRGSRLIVAHEVVIVREDRNPCFHDDAMVDSFVGDPGSCGVKDYSCLIAEASRRTRDSAGSMLCSVPVLSAVLAGVQDGQRLHSGRGRR